MKSNRIRRIICLILVFAFALGGMLPPFTNKRIYAGVVPDDFPDNKVAYGENPSTLHFLDPNNGNHNIFQDIQYSITTDENGETTVTCTITSDIAEKYSIGLSCDGDDGKLHHYVIEKDDDGNVKYVTKDGGFRVNIQTTTDGNEGYGGLGFVNGSLQEDSSGNITFQLKGTVGSDFEDFEHSKFRVWIPENSDVIFDVDLSNGTSAYHLDADGHASSEEIVTIKDDDSIMRKLEKMISSLLNGITNAINILIANVLGRRVTIDDLVFDDYPDTKLSYFSKVRPANASDLIWGKNGYGGVHDTINNWYSFFRGIAIIGYMIILVYMGIRIMLSSTGKGLAQFKSLFMYWVVGVAILFFYPYVMKYAIELNVAFVRTIKGSRDAIIGVENIPKAASIRSIGTNGNSIEKETFDASAFSGGANDYMSIIADAAVRYKRIAVALTYMILTWQLITLTIHYYKRLLMTGFLITIFPLVALSYAVDKIADGKSQAFNKWNKEFILNVFIQSFHAIVYVFVCGTIYKAGGMDAGGGEPDYVLVLVGVTFLFTGEEIIKKIFAQESPAGSVKSLAATAGTAFVAAKAVKGVVSKTVKPFVGKDSIINKAMNYRADIKTADTKARMFDTLAQPNSEPNAGMRLDNFGSVMSEIDSRPISDEEKQEEKKKALILANAVATWNNPNSRSVEDLVEAKKIIDSAMKNDPTNPLLANSKFTQDELKAFNAASAVIATSVAAGNFDPIQIQHDVRAELAFTFPSMDEDTREKYTNAVLADAGRYGAKLYTAEGTQSEFMDYMSDINELNDSFMLTGAGYVLSDENAIRRTELEEAAYQALGERANRTNKKLAQALVVYNNRNSDLYSTEEKLNAMNTIRRFTRRDDKDDVMNELLNSVDDDFDVSRHLFAKKVAGTTGKSATNRERKLAKEILKQYEGEGKDTRRDFDDEEFSIHQIIANMGDDDAMGDMYEEIYTARRRKNQEIRETTMDIAQDILAMEGVDLKAGSIDTTTKYLDGQTKEQVERAKRDARFDVFFKTATGESINDFRTRMSSRARDVIDVDPDSDGIINRGFSKIEKKFRDNISSGYSQSYINNRQTYNQYNKGDQ